MRINEMKKIVLLLSVVSFCAFSGSILADEISGDNYWAVELGQATLGEDGTFPGEDELDETYVNAAFGYRYNRFISAEANLFWWQLNKKLTPDDLSTGQEVNFESGFGLSIRGDFPIYQKLSGFAQVSYNMLNFDLVGVSPDGHDNGVGYGAGLEYDFMRGAIFAKYSVLMDNENDDPAEFQLEDFTSMGVGYKLDLPF